MRYCPNCKRINESWPERCRFCGLTWGVRLCRRGHPNPTNAVFCGECGSADLTNPALGGRLLNCFFKLLQYTGILGLFIKIIFPLFLLIICLQDIEAFMPLIVSYVILILVLKYSIGMLPGWIRKLPRALYKLLTNDNNRAKERDRRGL